MSKFSGSSARPLAATGALATTSKIKPTHEGGLGHAKDAKTKLYTLAVTNMVGEDTFYEKADERDDGFAALIAKVSRKDPDWVGGFVPWLRNTANMRSAAVVMACEYTHALLVAQKDGTLERGVSAQFTPRRVIDSACARADEPAEVIAYWHQRFGRSVPSAVKRGVGDACQRLYTEYAALKYDGGTRGVRMGDVIEIVHPTPKAPWQSQLFKFLLDKRHRGVDDAIKALPDTREERAFIEGRTLPKIKLNHTLERLPLHERRIAMHSDQFGDSGFTWERLGGWLPPNKDGKVLDAEAWEAMIPTMGYMSLLRNIRNFEEAGISPAVAAKVAARLADPEEVAKSRQFPYRFWSAYKNSGTMFFGPALEQALQHSLLNVPVFPGRSEVLIDTSGSMQNPVTPKSSVQMWEIGALFAAALAVRDRSKVDVILYATDSMKLPVKSPSVLRIIDEVGGNIGEVGHGTATWPNAMKHYDGHDRILAFTDCQDHPVSGCMRGNAYDYDAWNRPVRQHVVDTGLPDVPIHVWDLAGYKVTNLELGPNRYAHAGFTDADFRQIPLLERGRDQGWPWQ